MNSVLKKTVPLYKVVAGAMVDAYEDISKGGVQQTYSFWAARGLKKLNNESLKLHPKKALIHINKNTHTGTLPLDFEEESFVGIIDNYGRKVSIRLNTNFTDTENIEDIPCDDSKCPKCDQNTAICTDLTVTEDTVIVIINNNTYEQTIIKKLYPDGSYFLETKTPVLNINTGSVEYFTQKEFIAKLSLKPCGCIEDTKENIEVIKCNAYETYCSYYAPCCNDKFDYGYEIFPETGLIKVSHNFPYDKIYIEFRGYLTKKNGQYHVPEVCFETLVEWVKFKAIDGKPNVALSVKDWRLSQYKRERKNMERIIGRVTLEFIIDAVTKVPKFDLWHERGDISLPLPPVAIAPPENDCNMSQTTCPPASGKTFIPLSVAVIAGNGGETPTVGINTYQNDKFKNAVGINLIVVNQNNEMIQLTGMLAGTNYFTLDTVNGILSRFKPDGSAQNWESGDSLIITQFSKLI